MTKLISTLFEKEIDLETPKFLTLVVENKTLNYEICKYLYNDFCGRVDYFKLFNDDKKLDLSTYALFVYNLFSLDLNTKKNINALYKLLKKSCSESLQLELKNIKESIVEIVRHISLDFDVELDVNNNIKEDDFFKIVDLRFSESDDSHMSRFKKYVETAYELTGMRVCFVNHLHDYFDHGEIESLLHELSYKNITIINLEHNDLFQKLANEDLIIIDRDLCTIE